MTSLNYLLVLELSQQQLLIQQLVDIVLELLVANLEGNVTGNLTGNVTGGTISGSTGSFSGDITISKTDPTLILHDTGGTNTDPSGRIVFKENELSEHFHINYNGLNDRLEFIGLIGGNLTDLVYINRDTTTALNVFGGGNFTGQITIPETPTANSHAASKKYVDDNTGTAEVAKRIEVTVKNISGGSLAKGVVVHASPNTGSSGNLIEVVKADANVAASMPAIGVLNETIADEAEGEAVMFGAVTGIDTSSFTAGVDLYVSETAGEFTQTKPTAFTSQVQKNSYCFKSSR